MWVYLRVELPSWTIIASDSTGTSVSWDNWALAKSYVLDYTWDVVVYINLAWSTRPTQYKPIMSAKIKKNGVDIESFYKESDVASYDEWDITSNSFSVSQWDTVEIYIKWAYVSSVSARTDTYYNHSEIRVA